MRTTSMQMSFPETVSVCAEILWLWNRLLQQLSGWLSQTILEVKMLWLQSDQQVVCVSCLFSVFVVEITWVRFDSLPCARCLHGSPCHRYLINYFSCLIHLFSLYLSPPRVQSCVWPLWCEHATLRSLPTFGSLFPSSCPGVPGVVFCGFSNSAHLCMLNRELPTLTLRQHWRWDSICCSLYTLNSLPCGVTGGLIGLIPSSCLHSLPSIMAPGLLPWPSFVFWDLNKYLSWTCNWIRVFSWQKMLDVEVLGWCGYTWSAVVRPVECTAKFSEMPLERRLMVDKWTFNSQATALVDIPAVSMPIARSLKTCDICGIVLCDKTAHFRVAFYCGQPKAHLCNNHAV